VQKSQQVERNAEALAALVTVLPVQALMIEAGQHYGDIRATLKRMGKPIGNNDLWIAAHARAMGWTLVTNNEREFSRVSELRLQNWAK
jgi:tRNA(fMet)-specific endonuclease VapC